MATNTDWSKFQRRQLYTLLKTQSEVGKEKSITLDTAIESLLAEMEKEDIKAVNDALKGLRN